MFFVNKAERKMNLFDYLFRTEIDTYSSCDDLLMAIDKDGTEKNSISGNEI